MCTKGKKEGTSNIEGSDLLNNIEQIILCPMFSQNKYVNTSENIGHEIINLFKADDSYNYLYYVPDGGLPKKTIRKICSKKIPFLLCFKK